MAATGGFQANEDWLRDAWGPVADNFIIRGTPYNKGRLLRLLIDQGAAGIGDPTQGHMVAIDGRSPKFDGGIATRIDCVPFSIVINKNAERFYDEGEEFWPKRYAIWGRLVAQQPDQAAFSIIDSAAINLFMPSVFPPIEANTISELAAKMGLDPSALEKTVSTFNSSIRSGKFDPAFLDDCRTEGLEPPKSHWAQPLDTPPYYGYPLKPGITFTYLGVSVNEKSQVIMQDDTASPNIFAAGEITGIAGGDKALIEGQLAALSILQQFGKLDAKKHRIRQAALLTKRKRCERFGAFLNRQWAILPREWDAIDDATIICRCEDITRGTIRKWIQEGFTHNLR